MTNEIAQRAEDAFWRERAAGNTKSDRGGYYSEALADLRSQPAEGGGR